MKNLGKLAAVVVAACTLFGGVGTAYADGQSDSSTAILPQTTGNVIGDKTSVSKITVSDVGAHTANVAIDYKIDKSLLPQIKNICFVADVQRITEITTTAKPTLGYAWGPYDVACSGVSDNDLTQSTYNQIYGLHKDQAIVDVATKVVGKATYQGFTRFYYFDDDTWGNKESGTFNLTLIGLNPNTTYGNRNLSQSGLAPFYGNLWNQTLKVYNQGGHSSNVNFSQLYAGFRIELKNGDYVPFAYAAKQVPDFTTTAEPATKPSTDLTDANKGSLQTSDKTVNAGSVARVYVNNLTKECAAKVEKGESCFWYSYIYSNPVRLTGPDGSPYASIEKDSAGKYYFEAYIPDSYSGDHKISLVDEKGAIQGWTDVTVKKKPVPAVKPVAVYRVYNRNSGLHHYTTSKGERDNLVKLGWRDEGTSFTAAAKEAANKNLKPVYREYNPNDGNHNWTMNKGEHDQLVKIGWRDEGIAWYVDSSASTNVYRLYNPNSGEHVYTTSKGEYDQVGKAGWRQEGIAWKSLK
ncbi:hypothetical protein [Bifidobacterium biavatii]|uniref:Glycosyl hydrolase family 25 n=1 Tax=Bifidobacterium biavatii DSM 23969 TaxID=1437608 RepID=A0A086ZN29_9BIFI|nr:hypothetical protein [Bifidobacterium biavatii]KFI47929.1 glycosyl hydrolase family 25 [Bifidobacterium biavatii DSM 23969]